MSDIITINLGSLDDDWGDYRFDPQSDKPDEAKAAWIYNGALVMAGSKYASTALWKGNATDNLRAVPCFDFSAWLEQFRGQRVVVKMDIEGAEYYLLQKMIDDGTVDIPEMYFIEWHDWLYPELKNWSDRLKAVIPFEEISPTKHCDCDALIESWLSSQEEHRQDDGVST